MFQTNKWLKSSLNASTGSCILRIRSHYQALNPSQRQLADLVLSQRETALDLDVTRLSKQAGVSAATVTRFCHRIGFAGFREFKIALAQEMVSVPLVFEDFDPADDDTTRVNKVFAAYIQSLIDTRAIVSVPHVLTVVDRITTSECVYLYGIGSSGLMAVEASHRLALLGIPCRAHTDPYEQIISASLSQKRVVAIGFSHSGTSRNTVEAIRIAREHGAFAVAITNYADSPLAREADVSLLTSLHEKRIHVATLTSRVAQLTLIDCLYILLASRGLDRFREATSSVEAELSRILRVQRTESTQRNSQKRPERKQTKVSKRGIDSKSSRL